MLGIAVADNKRRADDFKARLNIPFPVFPDEKGEIYMALKNPAVPSTMLTTTAGKVLMNHNGLIEDFDGMVKNIREIYKQ